MRLRVHTWGSGPHSVILVHGISGSARTWRAFAARLIRRFPVRVLAVDMRGHGDSPRARSYRLADFAADLRESLPAGADVAIGHSLGGRVLAEVAGDLRPARAVYLDPAFDVDLGAAGRQLLEVRGATEVVARVLGAADPAVPASGRRVIRESSALWDRAMTREVLAELDAHRLEPAAPVVPSTLLRASSYGLVRRGYADRLAALGWDVRTIRTRHSIPTLAPALLLDALEDVLRPAD